MAVAPEKTTDPAAGGDGPRAGQAEMPPASAPNLGRTVRVVGPVIPVHTSQLPHPKNQRGELGKALFHWYHNTVSKDPLTRVSAPNHFADRRNWLTTVV